MTSWQQATTNDVVGWLGWCVTVRKGANGSHGASFFASWLLSTWGVVQIICNSKIFAGAREAWERWWLRLPPGRSLDDAFQPENGARSFLLAGFLHCPMCVGWWLGALLHLVGFGCFAPGPLSLVLDGAAASAWCWTAFVVHKLATTWLGRMGVVL